MAKDQTLDFLRRLADGVADTFGEFCETVVHEIDEDDTTICYIRHGSVTGRKVGEKKSLFGDQSSIKQVYAGKDLANYHALTPGGKSIKSTTVHFKNDHYHYAFGINFDYTRLSLAAKAMEDLVKVGPKYEKILKKTAEVSISELFNQCAEQIGLPVSVMKKADRLRLVAMLTERQVFTIQGSVPEVAKRLGVSRFTIYNDLREIKEQKEP